VPLLLADEDSCITQEEDPSANLESKPNTLLQGEAIFCEAGGPAYISENIVFFLMSG
jgi:hypothetical protein